MSRLLWQPTRLSLGVLGTCAPSRCLWTSAWSRSSIGVALAQQPRPPQSFILASSRRDAPHTRIAQSIQRLASTSSKPQTRRTPPPPPPAEAESARPLASSPYDTEFSPTPKKGTSSEPSEELLNLPNLLTLSRILSTPFIGYLIVIDRLTPAVGLLFVAACTDLLDGWLARRWNKFTVFGSVADPAADKLLMTVMVVTLGWKGFLPPSLASLILLRDVGLVILAFFIRYRTLPAPVTWSRYWNPRLPSAQVEPTKISKYNTFLQLLSVGGALLLAALVQHSKDSQQQQQPAKGGVNDKKGDQKSSGAQSNDWPSQLAYYLDYPLKALWLTTAATTIISGWGYFVRGAGYKDLAKHGGASSLAAQTMKRMAERARQRMVLKRRGGEGPGEGGVGGGAGGSGGGAQGP